jgi:thiamine-phosphate pyrophosphorylase
VTTERLERLAAARLYLVVTPSALGPRWEAALERALGTGRVDVVQLREKEAPDRAFLSTAARLRVACDEHDALLILDDRVDLVLPSGADGAHVGEDDLPPEEARDRLGDDLLLGLSTHDAAEVRAAAGRGADHVGLGPCFPSGTKALARAPGGPALVAGALPAAGGLPVFPIGGITTENAPSLVAAGARRLAVGAGVLAAADPARAAEALARLLDRDEERAMGPRGPDRAIE